jgi:hypothetical protein
VEQPKSNLTKVKIYIELTDAAKAEGASAKAAASKIAAEAAELDADLAKSKAASKIAAEAPELDADLAKLRLGEGESSSS